MMVINIIEEKNPAHIAHKYREGLYKSNMFYDFYFYFDQQFFKQIGFFICMPVRLSSIKIV